MTRTLAWRAAALAGCMLAVHAVGAAAQSPSRYIIYAHASIVEDSGRRPVSPTYGIYEYDAILQRFTQAGFEVLSDQRGPHANSDSAAARIAHQVDSLIGAGVSPDAITVIGFSKGGWIAILASSRLRNPAVSFVFMAACGPWAFDRADLHVTGRLLSLYETSDSLGVSCAPLFARTAPGSETREIALSLGLGHGTFFQPRPAWLTPALAWARGRDAVPAADVPDPADVATIPAIMAASYDVMNGPAGQPRQWRRDSSLYMRHATFVATSAVDGRVQTTVMTADDYRTRNFPRFERSGLYETEIGRQVERFGNAAQVRSVAASRSTPGARPTARYVNYYQLYWDGSRWWIASIVWDEERQDSPIPPEWIGRWEDGSR